MMARLILFLGLMMIGGAAFVANDVTKASVNDPTYTFDLAEYASAMPARVQAYVSEDVGPRVAALPQTARDMVHNWQNPPEETVEATDRLAGLKERNTSIARNGVSIDDLTKMTPMEIYQNREAIMKGLTNSAKEQMSGVLK
jgi:hypothetical protein